MTHEKFTGETFNDLYPPGTGFQDHRNFSWSIAQKSHQIYYTKHMFYESGDYTDKIIVMLETRMDNKIKYARRLS